MAIPTEKCCIVVLGSTGLGKSSIVRAMTKQNVEISSSAQSETKECTAFPEPDSNRIWLDTMGAEDSDDTFLDEDILRNILRTIQSNEIEFIKLLWFVKKEVRCTPKLQLQARFIESLLSPEFNHGQNVWESVVIIIKEGENANFEHAQGALAAASSGEKPPEIPFFGFTCLEWLPENVQVVKRPTCELLSKEDRIAGLGLYYEEEVIEVIQNMIAQRPALKMYFEKRQCVDCGVIGDPRCLPLKCHDSKLRVHPSESALIHRGGSQYRHSQVLQSFHGGSVGYIHTGSTENYHGVGLEYYHSSGTTSSQYHPGAASGMSHVGELRLRHNFGIPCNAEKNHCEWCGASKTRSKKLFGVPSAQSGCRLLYDCCEGDSSSAGCTTKYSCCDSWGDGCTSLTKYTCCGGPIGSAGCGRRFGCCYQSEGSSGCRSRYTCCGRDSGQTGCVAKYSCCNKVTGSNGCQQKYGCCGKTSGQAGCQQYFSCCGQVVVNSEGGIGCSYACCGKPVGSEPCEVQCQRCRVVWGMGPGCTVKERQFHSFER